MKITGTNSQDITFCAVDCADKECARNRTRIKGNGNKQWFMYHRSFQDFSKECVDYREGK